MAQLPSDVPSLLLPMQGRPWLLPNLVVAEVVPLRHPDRPGHGPDWLLGWLNWRDLDLPLLSFERFNKSGQMTIGQDARIAILNTIRGEQDFYALIVQGIPRALKVHEEDVVQEEVTTGPAEAMYVQVGGELAVIPDLDVLESAVATLQLRP